MKLLFYLIFIVMIQSLLAQNQTLLTLNEVCSCSQLSENQCIDLCIWKNNHCEQAQCSELQKFQCQTSSECTWNGLQCKQAYRCQDWTENKVQCLNAPKSMRCIYEHGQCVSSNSPSLVTDCRLITNKRECTLTNCIWSVNGCSPFWDCSQANGLEETCLTNKSCTYREGQCQQRNCGDYLTKDTCTFVKSFNGGEGVSCQWVDEKCQLTGSISVHNEQTCTKNTGFTHHWNGRECQKCVVNKQFRQLASCTKTNADTGYSFTENQLCSCSGLQNSADCKNFAGCMWENNSCRGRKCEDLITSTYCISSQGCVWENSTCRTAKECSDWTTESDCDGSYKSYGCAWNGSCSKFTQCSDYTANSVSTCSEKSSGSSFCTETSSTNKKCRNADKLYCSDLTSQYLCDAVGCVWNSSGRCQGFTQCSDADGNSNACSMTSACRYCGSQCIENTCEDFTTQSTCTNHVNFQRTIGYLCQWENGKCSYAKDPSFLTASTCQTYTGGTHTWNGSSCVLCSSTNATILGTIMLALAVFI